MTVQIRQDGKCVIEGVEYPGVGYGTWPLRDDVCFHAILDAARIGYRIIDTATLYGNHVPIGKALKKLGREQYYVTSKVWPNNHRPQDLKKDLVKALEDLQTSYLDAYLLHWPNSKTPIEDTMEAMVAAQKAGLIRHIGLSNVTPNHLKRIFELKVPITWVQNEMHPHFYEPSEVQACTSHGIGFQAWGPLGRGRLVEDSLLKKISEKHHKTPAQVALRWIFQHQGLSLPGSRNPVHMQQNFTLWDFSLSKEEMEKIDAQGLHGERERAVGIGLGFDDEFDYSYEQCWPHT